MDDPLLGLQLHASTLDLFRTLLTALAKMSQGTVHALTAEQRSYLAQAMDIAADLDIILELLAEALDFLPPETQPDCEYRT
ncbi:MAG: hypothetical protein ACLP1E_05520 [Acidimicrobiales bacterium]